MPFDSDDSADRSDPGGEPRPTGEPNESPETRSRFWCPGCDEEVQVSPETIGQLVRCPYCNQDFFASDELSHQAVVDDTPPDPVDANVEDEINSARVKRLSALRLLNVRSGSWWLIGLVLSIVAIGAFTLKAIRLAGEARQWGVWPTVCMAVVAGAVWFARKCRRGLQLVKTELIKNSMPDPETAPDFSTLNDGHDRWQELEHIQSVRCRCPTLRRSCPADPQDRS